MDKQSVVSSSFDPLQPSQPPGITNSNSDNSSVHDSQSKLSPSGISSWAKSLKIQQPFVSTQDGSPTEHAVKSPFARFTSGLGLRSSPKADEGSDGSITPTQPGLIGTITKGLVDSSRNAVKAVQVKARHAVSQNKRRYQVGVRFLSLFFF